MTPKEHYENHLAGFYAWMAGDFAANVNAFRTFCQSHDIKPVGKGYAVDLGAGNGIQTVALLQLGYAVKAIDFSEKLLGELKENAGKEASVETILDDIRNVRKYASPSPELILCCGDTLLHLESREEIAALLQDCHDIMAEKGKLILSFRDYSHALTDTQRFIPVKSDSSRILTCFLEYTETKVHVTDLLHELHDGQWVQKVSSYDKTRTSKDAIKQSLETAGFTRIEENINRGMITLIADKNGSK